jgi:hypothetical protein
MAYIEVEQFSLRASVDREAFCDLDVAMQEWSYVHRKGLVRRTTAFGEDRDVLVLTLLFGASSPPPAQGGDAVAAFTEAIDPTTYRRVVYADRG